MVEMKCLSHDDPLRLYDYCPSFPMAIAFTILFALTTAYHTFQAFYYQKSFSWVMIMACIWEFVGYASRSISVTRQSDLGAYSAQQLVILLAPLWINAFIYMTLGRLLHFCLENDRVGGVRARRITLIFVLFDVTAFFVQATGGMLSSGDDKPISLVKTGLKVYTAGVGLQLAFMAFFCVIAVKLHRLLKKQDLGQARTYAMEAISQSTPYYTGFRTEEFEIDFRQRGLLRVRPLLIIVWASLALIFLRNIYRLIEYGIGGINGNFITKHELFLYVFDSVPMLAAMVLFNVYHPGRILQGPRCDFKSEDKARKAEKKALKDTKKNAKKQKNGAYVGTSSCSTEDLA